MQLRPFWCLWACLCILWAGGAAAQSLSPMRNEGYTSSAVKGVRLTVSNPYERRMRFVLVPMNPQFTRAVSGVRINPPEMVLAPGHARVVIPLGEQPERLDCSRLYELEIDRLKREIDLLKIGLE